MSVEERLEALETQSNVDCIFCHVRKIEWGNTDFHKITDDAVRNQFIKHGYTSCDHKQVGRFSILYSDFLADKLCSYVLNKYIERQNYDTILKIFQDKEIMIPLILEDKEPIFVGMAKDMYE